MVDWQTESDRETPVDNDYNDYKDSDLDLDLDWERFSGLVTLMAQLTITDKLRNWNHDIEG